jgi:hypothetical protein
MNATPRFFRKDRAKASVAPRRRYGSHRPRLWLLLFLAAAAVYLIHNARSYEDVVTATTDGAALTPERKAEISERQRKNTDQAEQYVLRAVAPGYRTCYLCPEGRVWLEAGEIAKIGVSTDGQRRYTAEFYEQQGVYYVAEYRGDLTTAKNRELARLGSYPLLPENQKRTTKLLYPPLNSKLD